MIRTKLANGLSIIIQKRREDTVTIMVSVGVGSICENSSNRGISHLLEHMLFEGTSKRPSNFAIANEVEKLGAELNAYTTTERTNFYVKVPKKHLKVGLDLIHDIVTSPLIRKKDIEKEKNIVIKEINMAIDEPRNYQWVLFQKTLFKRHLVRFPVYGSKKCVLRITKEKLKQYFEDSYTPNNMILCVAGGFDEPITYIKNKFSNLRGKRKHNKVVYKEPTQKKEIAIIKRKILNSYLVLGYKTPNRTSYESYILDVIKALLARGQSGRMVEEIRGKKALSYEVSVHHDPALDHGMFTVYLSTSKSKLKLAEKTIISTLHSLRNITEKELNDAKGHIEGKYVLENEDNKNHADELTYWEMAGSSHLLESYLKTIKKVKKQEVINAAKKFFTKEYVLVIIKGD